MVRSPSGWKASAAALLVLTACGTAPPHSPTPRARAPEPNTSATDKRAYFRVNNPTLATDVVLFALGLVDTGYRFGGTNPEAGLDCSGMVSYIFDQVTGTRLPHNAARIAHQTRPVPREQLRPGDLVFFNTRDRTYSHVGLYIGGGRFIHAPSSRGKVRVDRMDNVYFSPRFDGARTLFD